MPHPLSHTKKEFGSKKDLIEAVKKLMTDDLWLPRLSADRGGSKGIEHVSNKKLLRLVEVLGAVKKEFGTRAKLIAAVLELDKRGKDEGYKKRLEAYPVPRLYDLYKSRQRRAKTAQG
jgi:hypothetical protein